MKQKIFFLAMIVIHNTVYSSVLKQSFDLFKESCNEVVLSCSRFGLGKGAVFVGLGGAVGYYVYYKQSFTNSQVNRHALKFKNICHDVVSLEERVKAFKEEATDLVIIGVLYDSITKNDQSDRSDIYKENYIANLGVVERCLKDTSETLAKISLFWENNGDIRLAGHPKSKTAH